MDTTIDRSALEQKLIPELQRIAQEMGIEGTQRLRKAGLIDAIVAGGNGGDNGSAVRERPARRARRNGGERRGRSATTADTDGAARRAPLGGRRADTDDRSRPSVLGHRRLRRRSATADDDRSSDARPATASGTVPAGARRP